MDYHIIVSGARLEPPSPALHDRNREKQDKAENCKERQEMNS